MSASKSWRKAARSDIRQNCVAERRLLTKQMAKMQSPEGDAVMSMGLSETYDKILVTGASGRLGSNLVKRLTDDGATVRSFMLPDDPAEKNLDGIETEKVYGDLADETAVDDAVDGVDVIVHCAAVMHEPEGMSPHRFFDINTRGTFNVLQSAKERADQIRKIVYISSTAAYSVQNAGPVITEQTPLRPIELYGTTKVANEAMARCVEYQTGIPIVILRPNFILAGDEALNLCRAGGVIGVLKKGVNDPRFTLYVEGVEEPWKIVEEAVERPAQRCIPRDLDGNPWVWHVTDVRDMVQAVLLSLAKDSANGKTFNIAGPNPLRWDEFVPYICERLGEEYVEVTIPNLWHFEFYLGYAEEHLGYDPEYTTERMIDDAIAYRDGNRD